MKGYFEFYALGEPVTAIYRAHTGARWIRRFETREEFAGWLTGELRLEDAQSVLDRLHPYDARHYLITLDRKGLTELGMTEESS